MMSYSIKQVADMMGVTTATIRYYDDEGYLYHQHDLEKTFERRAHENKPQKNVFFIALKLFIYYYFLSSVFHFSCTKVIKGQNLQTSFQIFFICTPHERMMRV